MQNLTNITAGRVVCMSPCEIILVVHQAADMTGESKTILSAGQLEGFGNVVSNQPVSKVVPHISLPEWHKIPITFQKGLSYIQLWPFTDKDWESLPHVTVTSPIDWDPATLHNNVPESWFDAQSTERDFIRQSIFSKDGRLKEDLEDNDEENFNAKQHYTVDRKGIMAHLTSLITDKITHEYIMCEYNGETVTVKEYNDKPSHLCYPVEIQSQQKTKVPPEDRKTEPAMDEETNTLGGNNRECTIKEPKFLKPSKKDLG